MTVLRLTPTHLAAREARADDALAQRQAGARVWQPTPVAALPAWIEQQWLRQWPTEQLLSGPPLLALWRQVVESDDRSLLSPQACARLALAADQLARRHGIDPARMPAYTEEHQTFRRWHREMHRRLQDLDALTPADLPSRLPCPQPPPAVTTPGPWPPLPPSEHQLLARYGNQLSVPAAPAPVESAWVFEDADAQYRGLAAALRPVLLSAEQRPLRVLMVVNDPQARARIEAALTEALAPWRYQPESAALLPWRWATAAPLTDTAWAQGWQQLAQLSDRVMPFAPLSALLLNPALWPGPLALEAAVLECALRAAGWRRIDLDGLAELADRHAPSLAVPLRRLSAQLRREPRQALPGDWHGHFAARMAALLGADEAVSDSLRFQIRRATTLASSRLGSLDRLLGPISAGRAAEWLSEWLQAPFQPRVEHPQPLLLGPPEALVGIPCDLLVVADASSDLLPGKPPLNPFLPVDSQRASGVAAAHPLQWQAHQQQLFAALQAGAKRCWLARPQVDARGAPVLPCPWLSGDWQTPAVSPMTVPVPAVLPPADDPVPPVSAAEGVVASAALFERHLAAPLLSLCVDRLGASPLDPAPRGLPPWLQGTLIHEALAQAWQSLQTAQTLRQQDDAACVTVATEAVDAVLPLRLPERRFGSIWVALERQRAIDLVAAWLRHERRRDDDFTVIAHELTLEGQVAGLPVKLRLDRADRVRTPFGEQVLLLDYKTGREANPRGWDEDRLAAPQLPLYAVLGEKLPQLQPVGGIGFAHLKEGHPTLSARTAWATRLIDGVNTAADADWPSVLSGWRTRLELAAQSFLAGDAGADPRVLTHHLAPYAALLADATDPDDGEDRP